MIDDTTTLLSSIIRPNQKLFLHNHYVVVLRMYYYCNVVAFKWQSHFAFQITLQLIHGLPFISLLELSFPINKKKHIARYSFLSFFVFGNFSYKTTAVDLKSF